MDGGRKNAESGEADEGRASPERFESILPPITPPAWTSFMTGKNPGKHGIFHFVETEHGGYAMNYANGGSRRSPTVWKLLNDAGLFCRHDEHSVHLST